MKLCFILVGNRLIVFDVGKLINKSIRLYYFKDLIIEKSKSDFFGGLS